MCVFVRVRVWSCAQFYTMCAHAHVVPFFKLKTHQVMVNDFWSTPVDYTALAPRWNLSSAFQAIANDAKYSVNCGDVCTLPFYLLFCFLFFFLAQYFLFFRLRLLFSYYVEDCIGFVDAGFSSAFEWFIYA